MMMITSIDNSEQCNHNSIKRFTGWFNQELSKIKRIKMEISTFMVIKNMSTWNYSNSCLQPQKKYNNIKYSHKPHLTLESITTQLPSSSEFQNGITNIFPSKLPTYFRSLIFIYQLYLLSLLIYDSKIR